MTSELYARSDSLRQVSNDFTRRIRTDNGIDAKIVVLGNSGVGKTSLLQRYVQDNFDPAHTHATTSAFFAAKRVHVDGHKVRLQLWDTAGQERFRSMAPIYYRGANAALLLYDITSYPSFEDLKTWLEELKKNCTTDLIIYIVGAKADLYHQRQVSSDRIRLSLHQWFPPPRRPSPEPTPPIIEQPSYIRPRFTSLTSLTTSRSVTFLSPRIRTKSHSQSPPNSSQLARAALQRSNTVASANAQLKRPTDTLVRRSTASGILPSFENNIPRLKDDGLDSGASSLLHSKNGNGATPSRQIAGQVRFPDQACEATSSVEEVDETDHEDDDQNAVEWGVDQNTKLFEVSAKDDKGLSLYLDYVIQSNLTNTTIPISNAGVRELFDTLIRAVIAKKEIIDQEREVRERDSVYLSNGNLTPTWAAVAEEEEARLAQASRWTSCCS